MKKYIKSAVSPWKTKYEVHWISPDGKDCLLGGSNDINEINEMARAQARHIYSSPFETPERKLKFIESIYLVEVATEYDAMLSDTEDLIERMVAKLKR